MATLIVAPSVTVGYYLVTVPKTHTVQPGECLASIAHQYNFRSWKVIYEAPENAALRKKRPNPNVLYEGDKVVIPDLGTKTTTDHSHDKQHHFKVKSSKWILRIRMKDEEGNPIGGEPFELSVPGVGLIRGSSKPDGMIEQEVPATVRSGKLKFMGEEFNLQMGLLDPISRIKGIQGRLNNLGFHAGPVDGIMGPQTRRALYKFQLSQKGLNATGLVDDDTRAALLKIHDNDLVCPPMEEDAGPQEVEDPPGEVPEPGEDPPDDSGYAAGEADWLDTDGCHHE